jgi:DNA-binding MarR family transcriptional regulator
MKLERMQKSDFNLNQQNARVESRIIASLERISQAFRVLLWQESKEFALSPIQIQVLIFLAHHHSEQRKVSHLAREFNMTKATISETIKTLEQKQLISKEFEQEDLRSYIIHLTKKGLEIAEKTALFTNQLRIPVQNLDSENKEKMLLSLLHIIHHLNQSGIITIQRMCFTCSHYQRSKDGQPHFCKLLDRNLATTDLRIDCPEHLARQEAQVNPAG